MSQKFIKSVNNNNRSSAFGKCFATAIYDKTFIETKQLAEFIHRQVSSAPTSSQYSTNWAQP